LAPSFPDKEAFMQTEVWARRSFAYSGVEHSRGSIFSLCGMRNDEKLVRLGYVRKCTELDLERKVQCGVCGAWFIGVQERDLHGKKMHGSREMLRPVAGSKIETPPSARLTGSQERGGIEDESSAVAEERKTNQMAPLYLENTAASRDAGVGGIEISSGAIAEANKAMEDSVVVSSQEQRESQPEQGGKKIKKASPKRKRSKKKRRKKTKLLSRKKTGGRRGRPREKIVDEAPDSDSEKQDQ